eukprot:Selendium_serpulae@DN6183_c0_g1_i3.p1
MAGVTVNEDSKAVFNEQKFKSKHKYVLYKLSKDLDIVEVDKKGEKDDDYQKFFDSLPAQECRYATVDIANPDTAKQNRLVFILWAPDNANVKDRMVYASSKEKVTKLLPGIMKVIQANEKSDLELAAVTKETFM